VADVLVVDDDEEESRCGRRCVDVMTVTVDVGELSLYGRTPLKVAVTFPDACLLFLISILWSPIVVPHSQDWEGFKEQYPIKGPVVVFGGCVVVDLRSVGI